MKGLTEYYSFSLFSIIILHAIYYVFLFFYFCIEHGIHVLYRHFAEDDTVSTRYSFHFFLYFNFVFRRKYIISFSRYTLYFPIFIHMLFRDGFPLERQTALWLFIQH